ncbi:ABC transporter substrate-binding protein [Streptomyces sp. NBC_01803]|uniref:ABC transporter substrate-binding protein n=1 Tax=Streptomyces sp. NBC_01803 TaxID=2975946 RepID=UPI002DD88F93|nr:ABC transporter substrate-binding protein [Streptomyces sp. NBC_01803]WSA45873.1 ABC transporter substrate-binding protein [Streptomyces sp. NBC_01803]
MRRIRARGAIGIGLAVAVVVGAIGGWMVFRPDGGDKEPIVVGSTATPTMVDPGGAYDAGAWSLMSNLYQSLLTFTPGQEKPVPDAAESCGFTDNELTVFRCRLRDDLTFSDGDPVTPEDVKFSYDRVLAMAARAEREAGDDSIPEEDKFVYAGPAALLASLEAVRIDGRDIVFELNQPDATFPFIVAGSAGAIVDQDSYEELEPRTDGRVVGSGPYLLVGYQEGVLAELEPNPAYRGAAEVPEFPVTVRYFRQAEDGTPAERLLAEAWEAGELDVNDGKMPPQMMAEINISDPDFRFSESTDGSIRVLAFNTREGAPMADETAREVAASLLDREAISRHVQQDTVEPLYSLIPVGFTGHGTPYYDRYRDRDPDELRDALESAGLEVPVAFHLAYSRGVASNEEADLMERQLEADGLFEVQIQYYDWSQFIPTVYGTHPYDAYLVGWSPDFPDPATFTAALLGPGDGLNTGYHSDTIDELIARTQTESDRGRAAEDFRTIHEHAADEAPIIPIWQAKQITISRSDITGIQHLSTHSGVWRLWELRRI